MPRIRAGREPVGDQQLRWLGIGVLATIIHLGVFALLTKLIRLDVSDDLLLFFNYGQRMAKGEVPYRDFALEYPPLAAIAFWLPARLTGAESFAAFRLGFGLEMAVANLCALLAALWAWRRHFPHLPPLGLLAIWPLWLLIAGQSLALERFDLWPAAFVILAIAFHANGKTRLAWLMIGLGTASKLYPALLAPLLLIAQRGTRTRRQLCGDLASCGAAILIPTGVVTHGNLLAVRGFFAYHLARGLEIESLYASFLLLGHFFGGEFDWAFRYGSIELVSPLAGTSASLALPLTLLVLGGVYAYAWYTRPPGAAASRTPGQDAAWFTWLIGTSLATIATFIFFGKVLSPQYLVWVIPLAALVPAQRGLRCAGILTLALLLTRCVNPLLWNDLSTFAPTAIIALLLRNLVLLGFLFAVVLPARTRTSNPAPAPNARADRALQHEPSAH